MISIILGLIFIAFTVFAVLPAGPLAWGSEVISFLKGGAPVLAALIGLICLFIGAADIKDKKEAKKEDAAKNDARAKRIIDYAKRKADIFRFLNRVSVCCLL